MQVERATRTDALVLIDDFQSSALCQWAVEAGLFELTIERRTASHIARALGLALTKVSVVLPELVELRLLEWDRRGYRNREVVTRCLTSQAAPEDDLREWIGDLRLEWTRWVQLDSLLDRGSSGQGVSSLDAYPDWLFSARSW